MSTKIYECRWADCHREFKEVDSYKEHIEAHIEDNPARPVSDVASYRRAAGFGPTSSAPQPELNYLNTQESFTKTMSPPERPQNKTGGRGIFSALGLAAGASPASFSPLMPSPSMSAKIRDISSPRRSQMRGRWSPPSPMSGLAMDATPSLPVSQAAPQSPPGSNEDGPSSVDVTGTPVPARSQSSDEDAPVDSSRKRKQGVMFTEPTTPANKKKKKNPKTPFPDPDLDSSEEDEDEDEDAPADDDAADDPYMIATQAPAGSSWDGLSTPEFEEEVDAPSTLFVPDLDGTGEAHIEEADEEEEVASQLGNVSKA